MRATTERELMAVFSEMRSCRRLMRVVLLALAFHVLGGEQLEHDVTVSQAAHTVHVLHR